MIKRIFFIFMLIVAQSSLVCAIDAPKISCISLDENDNVTITWIAPIDTGSVFNAYVLYYRSNSLSQFSPLFTSNNYLQNSETIVGSFAGSGSFYMVSACNGTDTSAALDTISPIIISLFTNGRNVEIQWLANGINYTDSSYTVYRRKIGGNWEWRGNVAVNENRFLDTANYCDQEFEFKIEISGLTACVNSSNVAYKRIIDDVPPALMNLNIASVDTSSGAVFLSWDLNPSADVQGYRLFYYSDFQWDYKLYGPGNLNYLFGNNNINAQIGPETLSIAAFDSCLNSVTNWYNQAATVLKFQTLFLQQYQFDRCSGTATLKWNMPKPGYPVGVRHTTGFKVFRNSSIAGVELRATLTELDSVFMDDGILPGKKYTYVVVAVDSILGVEAMSNKLIFNQIPVNEPEVQYITQVVNNHQTNENEIHLLIDSTSEVKSLKLMRSIDLELPFQEANKMILQPGSKIILTDITGKANNTSYYYRIDAFDECDAFISSSNVVRSILLNAEKLEKDYASILSWNVYQGFESENEFFELIRVPPSSDTMLILNSILETAFTDTLEQIENLDGNVCYYVKYTESNQNSYNISGQSISNLSCTKFAPRVFIPNAFSPDQDGINDIFLPVVNYVDQNQFDLKIYNRIGNLIFQSANPNVGWDGQSHETGVYFYQLFLTNSFGDLVEYTGKIILLR